MNPLQRAMLAALWLALLLGLAGVIGSRLQLSGDLRLFMPAPQTADQRLLLGSLGEGPGSRLLLLALSGAAPEVLADHSQALRIAASERPELRRVMNGEQDLDAFGDALLPYRYLLSPTLDTQALDADFLRAQLQARLQDLGSPAASLVEPWLARDPSLEVLRLAERWQPVREPERVFDVWFTGDGKSALLLVETAGTGFDPQSQQAAIEALRTAFESVAGDPAVELEISGPGAFSVLMRERTQGEATRLGITASALLLMLMALAYQSLRLPLLGALPLASAALAGLAAVAALFGSVHGITLAFGFTLIGVAQDYPVHLFSHRRPGQDAWHTVRELWPTLAAGAVSTCLAYLSFLTSGVEGLKQLAVFAIAGLLAAAASTRWLLPALLPAAHQDLAEARLGVALHRLLQRLPRHRALAPLLAALAIAWLVFSPRPLWDDNLASLTPVPTELLQRDGELRAALGAPDVRYLLVLEAADSEALLQASEALEPALDVLVQRGVLGGFELPSRYLPSAATQRARQGRLPAAETLRADLATAAVGLPFRSDAFAPFLADVEAARGAAILGVDDLLDTPLGARVAALLPATSDSPVALLGLIDVNDPSALSEFAAARGDALHLLDLKAASEALSSSYRERVLGALLAAFVLLLAALTALLRSAQRVLRVMAPVLLAGLLTLAVLHAGGVAFNLFHLVALILASGLGLDYALFFERAGSDAAEQRRTLHAIALCALSTGLVFGLLGSSSIPVLRAIGLSVALGVFFNFILAASIAGRGATHARP